MIKSVVGAKVYSVWVEMLRTLVPGGRTHRLSVMIAGMLQYAYETSYKKSATSGEARELCEIFEAALETGEEEDFTTIVEFAERIFDDAEVQYERVSRRGDSYSIAEEAAIEFLNWSNMPWES